MQIFDANISKGVIDYFKKNISINTSVIDINNLIKDSFNIINFIETESELDELLYKINNIENEIKESNRAEYGDFQTNLELANKVVIKLINKGISPEILLEPTCGKGNFIISSINNFKKIQKIYGIEIYKPYVWECKFNIINFYLHNNVKHKPEILISHSNVFEYDFESLSDKHKKDKILIIGNPPWVTNSMLGSLNSINLPKKNNFKNHNGLDAITGKGNFDIAEYITIDLIKTFENIKGHIALLIKSSVVKNIVYDQKNRNFSIGNIEKHYIDCKKEFNVSVDAGLFFLELNSLISYTCKEFNLYDSEYYKSFGWINDKFVSNTITYSKNNLLDGESPFEWRQGVKHDCSSIMDIEKKDGFYTNKLNDIFNLEPDLVYGLLKSSDLKDIVINKVRKYTIITQNKIGQDTNYIKEKFPKTYTYLSNNEEKFNNRKSIIYKNKPKFSIFGVGDYSFSKFKIAISGLYKKYNFSLILPENDKPIVLDDTCYMIGFDKIEYAVYTLLLLNSDPCICFLKSITFLDAKRTFTKDILKRIDIIEIANIISEDYMIKSIHELNTSYSLNVNFDLWQEYKVFLLSIKDNQLQLL